MDKKENKESKEQLESTIITAMMAGIEKSNDNFSKYFSNNDSLDAQAIYDATMNLFHSLLNHESLLVSRDTFKIRHTDGNMGDAKYTTSVCIMMKAIGASLGDLNSITEEEKEQIYSNLVTWLKYGLEKRGAQ